MKNKTITLSNGIMIDVDLENIVSGRENISVDVKKNGELLSHTILTADTHDFANNEVEQNIDFFISSYIDYVVESYSKEDEKLIRKTFRPFFATISAKED